MTDVDLTPLRADLTAVRQRVQEWKGQATLLRTQQDDHKKWRAEFEARSALKAKALVVLQKLEATWRGRYEAALAALGSQGLNAVFTDAEYELLLESTIKRGVSSLDIVLVKDGQRVRLKGGSGGSVVQVLAYLLRHLMTVSQRPDWRRFEALDEPFAMVRAAQRPALGAMVKDITQRLDFQLLFSSDEDELVDAADVVILVHPGGKVEQLKSGQEDRA